jgi:hypothetical protein
MRTTTTTAALLLTLVSFAKLAAQPSLSVFASAIYHPNQTSCDAVPVLTSGVLGAATTCPGDGASAAANASYRLVLGASAMANTPGWQGTGSATVTDTYTPTAPGRSGQAGQLVLTFSLSGSTALTNSDNDFDAVAEFNAIVRTGGNSHNLFDQGGVFRGPAVIIWPIDIVYGQPFTLLVHLAASAYARYDDTFAQADFSHTAEIASFEFRDANGAPIQGVTVTSQSGVNPFETTTTEPPPAPTTIDDIIKAVDAAVLAHTLDGAGPGNSAKGRLGAWRNMLTAAKSLIQPGSNAACSQLQDAYLRADGAAQPPDFVAGSSAAKIDGMIHELLVSLGCVSG